MDVGAKANKTVKKDRDGGGGPSTWQFFSVRGEYISGGLLIYKDWILPRHGMDHPLALHLA